MNHTSKVAELNHECWTRAKAHLWSQLGREPQPWELANHVLYSQMYALAMMLLDDAEQLAWFTESIAVVQQGRPQGSS